MGFYEYKCRRYVVAMYLERYNKVQIRNIIMFKWTLKDTISQYPCPIIKLFLLSTKHGKVKVPQLTVKGFCDLYSYCQWKRRHQVSLLWKPRRNKKSRLENKGREHCLVCQLWLLEGLPGMNPRVGKGVNPAEFPLSTTTCAKLAFSDGTLGAPRWASHPSSNFACLMGIFIPEH